MAVLQMLPVLEFLRDYMATVTVTEGQSTLAKIENAFIGLAQSLPKTPACAVYPERLNIDYLPAGRTVDDQSGCTIAIFVKLTPNREVDETELLRLTDKTGELLTAPSFDYTLGELVNDTKYQGASFSTARLNNLWYRVAYLNIKLEKY